MRESSGWHKHLGQARTAFLVLCVVRSLHHPLAGAIGLLSVVARNHPDHVPIGLIRGGTIVENVDAGSLITRDQIELPESLAHRIWRGKALV